MAKRTQRRAQPIAPGLEPAPSATPAAAKPKHTIEVGKADIEAAKRSVLERTLGLMGLGLDDVKELEWQGSTLHVKGKDGVSRRGEVCGEG